MNIKIVRPVSHSYLILSDLDRKEITEELCNTSGWLVLEIIRAYVAKGIRKQLMNDSDRNVAIGLRLWATFASSGPTNQMLY